MDLVARVVELECQLALVSADRDVVVADRDALAERVRLLEGRLADLDKLLGRNSSNSSKPPSSDSGTVKSDRSQNANRAERRAMGRSQGKQRGAEGRTLSQVIDPDEVVMHQPERCRRCAQDLDDAETVGAVRRQVFDVPIPRPAVTEHVAVQRRCRCGCVTTARFTHGVNAPAVYGPEVKAHAVYLMTAQHLPRERCVETLRELFGVQVSTGTLDNWLSEAAARLDPFVAEVTTQLRSAPFMHADETSVRSGKAALWVHVCSTALLTLLHVGRRDKATIQAGPLGDYHGTIVHDRYATYFGLGAGHVLCNAHILRSLHEITLNRTHQAWATAFITLITTTKHAADTARTAGKRRLRAGERRQIRSDWDRLAAQATALTPPPRPGRQLYGTDKDARNLAIALAKHRDLFLAYTNDLSLPFDNNQGERDLRMIKLQSKISGEFRSTTGAARYAKLRSYVSTTRKHGESVHQHLRNLFTPTGAWLPTPT